MIRHLISVPIVAFALLAPLASAQQPDVRQLARAAGIIFSGTVEKLHHVPPVSRGDIGIVRVSFRVSQALRGATPGTLLTISEWDGLWGAGDRYRLGETLLLFLYPPSGELGLTTTVDGERGCIRGPAEALTIATVAPDFEEEPVVLPAPSKRSPPRRPIRLRLQPAE